MSEGVKVSGRSKDKADNNSTNKKNAPDLSPDLESPVGKILSLQRTIGNGAMQNLIESGIIQTKLKIGKPGDIYEQEADRIAEQVMRMPDSVCPSCVDEGEKEEVVNREVIQTDPLPSQESSFVQRQMGEEERKKREEEELIQPKPISEQITPLVQRQVEDTERKKREDEMVQTKERSSGGTKASADVESSINSLRRGGQPLPESARNYFEPRFGYDFSQVMVHTSNAAARAARSVNARAYTVGRDVVFGAGQYAPRTNEGQRLLSHELVHVMQQTNRHVRNTIQRQAPWEYVEKERELTPTKIPAGLNYELKNHRLYAHTTTNKDIDSVISLLYILNLYYKVNFNKAINKTKLEVERKGKKDGDRVSIDITEMLPDGLKTFLKRTESYFSEYRKFIEKQAKTPNPVDKRIYRTPEEIFKFYSEKIKRAKTKEEKNALWEKQKEVAEAWYDGYPIGGGKRRAVPDSPAEHDAACHDLMTLIISGTPKGVQPGQYAGEAAYAVPGETTTTETDQIVKSLATSLKGKGPHRVVPRSKVEVGDIAVFKARAPGYKRRIIVHSAVVIRVSGKEIELLEKTNDFKPMATRMLDEVLNIYKKDRGTVEFLSPALVGLPAKSKSGLGNKPPTGPFIVLTCKTPEDTFVLFKYDSIALLPHEDKKLFALIAMFKEPVSLFIHGYASIEGTEAYNLNLSAHRALTAKKALTPQLPSGSKTKAAAHGETRVFGSKPENRRASIQILSPVTLPKGGSTETKSTKTVEILNTANYTSSEYNCAIATWPDSMKIWPHLKSRKAKENFIRYIIKFDLTNCRPYEVKKPKISAECKNFERAKESFKNLCTGYAVQMHVRYSFAAEKLTAKEIANLQSAARIYAAKTPAKFRMPIFVATYPGHAFNAILVGPNKTDINSYIFLEPQADVLFDAKSATFKHYAQFRTLEISKLSSFSEKGAYDFTTVADFLMGSTGVFSHYKLTSEQRIAFDNISSDILVAEDIDTWTHSVVKRGLNFETYIKEKMERYKYEDKIIAFVGKFLIGRKFKRSPTTKYETLTREKFIKLMGRPSLDKLMPAK